jgi:Mg/Co/Ni transporter MgtE
MSPEFVCVYADATREEALERVGRSALPAESLSWVYGMNTHRRLRGGIALADLVRTDAGERLWNVLRPVQTVRADADLEEVARLMTDFDLTVVAVVDEDERILGIVTVDDVLELVLPEPWRRRFGLLGSD